MDYILKNNNLTVTISSVGGEITSVKSAEEIEYLWQADPAYWNEHAPHLFPYVGRFFDGKYMMDGKECEMGIHGFFRFQEMQMEEQTDTRLVLSFCSNEETRKEFDRDFKVYLTHELKDSTIAISFQVENQDSRTLYFGYGGHPGFNVPLTENETFEDYYLEFSEECQPAAIGLSATCFLQGAHTPISLENDKILSLKHNLFNNDAIVMRCMANEITLKSRTGSHGVTVSYPQMPYLGLWHKPHTEAPYVCIEPWVTLPSRQDVIEEFESKMDMVVVAPKKTYTNNWQITIF